MVKNDKQGNNCTGAFTQKNHTIGWWKATRLVVKYVSPTDCLNLVLYWFKGKLDRQIHFIRNRYGYLYWIFDIDRYFRDPDEDFKEDGAKLGMEKTTVDADNVSYKPTIDELIKKCKTEDQVWPPKKQSFFPRKSLIISTNYS